MILGIPLPYLLKEDPYGEKIIWEEFRKESCDFLLHYYSSFTNFNFFLLPFIKNVSV